MKTSYIIIALIIVIAIVGFVMGAKKDAVKTNNIQDPSTSTVALSDGTYAVNTETSVVNIQGEYTNGSNEDGTVTLKSGSLIVAKGEPYLGSFELDLESLKSEGNLVLSNYLKGKGLLDTDNFPLANFSITKVIANPIAGTTTGKYIVEGKLTVKDKTNSLSFPVTFSQKGNTITADSSFALNRSDWGVGDNKEIKNVILINLHIEASK